jgi:predicted ATPase
VTLFQLVRASGGGRRAGQRHLTPLVGRDEEIAMLMRRWERARQGDGQLVMIVGEPGLGKSRLIEEFHSRLRDTPHTWGEWSCSQLLQNTPLHPIADTRRPSLRNRARNCYRPNRSLYLGRFADASHTQASEPGQRHEARKEITVRDYGALVG